MPYMELKKKTHVTLHNTMKPKNKLWSLNNCSTQTQRIVVMYINSSLFWKKMLLFLILLLYSILWLKMNYLYYQLSGR